MNVQLDRVSFLVVQSALTRAVKHNVDSTGTDYLLRQIEDGPLDVWDELKRIKHALGDARQNAKAAGYLMAVSGTPGDPARWETAESVEQTPPGSAAAGELREAAWICMRENNMLVPWTGAFTATVVGALDTASQRGDRAASIRDLATALIGGSPNRATEGLTKAGADLPLAAENLLHLNEPVEGIRTPSIGNLERTGALSSPTKKAGLFGRLRDYGAKPALGSVVAEEAVRQAVRAGAETVSAKHIVTAIESIDAQVRQTGREWAEQRPAMTTAPAATPPGSTLLPAHWPDTGQDLVRGIISLESFADIDAAIR